MRSVLQQKGRQEYARLNKLFLEAVERGTSWDELQEIIDQMKSLAVYLQEIPNTLEALNVPVNNTSAKQEAADLEDPVAE